MPPYDPSARWRGFSVWTDISVGAIGNDIADDTAAIQTNINAASDGAILWLPASSVAYKITDRLTVPQNNVNLSARGALIHQTVAGKSALRVTGAGFSSQGLRLRGHGNGTSRQTGEYGIHIYSAADAKLEDIEVYEFGEYGILIEGSTGARITRPNVHDVTFAGIIMLSGAHNQVLGGNVRNITATGFAVNGYGITLTNAADTVSGALATTRNYPTDCSVVGVDVSQVHNWTGIDCHGGQRIKIIGNNVTDCRNGIVTTFASTGGIAATPIMDDIEIVANTGTGTAVDTAGVSANAGLWIAGEDATHRGTNFTVIGNTFSGFNGLLQFQNYGGFKCDFVDKITVGLNKFNNNWGAGMTVGANVTNMKLCDNQAIDNKPGSGTGGAINGIGLYVLSASTVIGSIDNNACRWTGDVAWEQQYGIYVTGAGDIRAANNTVDGNSISGWVGKDNLMRSYGTAAPTTLTWQNGDQTDNVNPSEAGAGGSKYIIVGWVNVLSGTPGTWRERRTLTGN